MGTKNDTRKKEVRDGWGRLIKGYGSRRLNKAETRYVDNGKRYTDDELSAIWETDGFSRRVITCIPEDMVNKGFIVVGDPANINLKEMDRLNWTGNFFNALCMSRLMGGSAILMGIDDGRKLERPVSINSIRGINFLRVIPRNRMTYDSNDIDTDPASRFYGMPSMFEINDGISRNPYKVHRDRLILLPWIDTSVIKPTYNPQNRIWGTPILNYVNKQVGNLSVFHDSLANLVQEAVIGKYKVSNLTQMLSTGEESKVMTRLDIMNEAKSVINAVILDADNDEDYTRDSLSFAGMNGVADTMMVLLSCVAEVPVTRLFGRSPSGLDASGESDLKIYYDMVSSYQRSMLTEPIKKLIFYIDKYKRAIQVEPIESLNATVRNGTNETQGEVKRSRPLTEGDVAIEWNALYQMTEKEAADVYKSNSDADRTYIDLGILSREEVRVNRFVGGYNQKISVETADLPEDPAMNEAEEVGKTGEETQKTNEEGSKPSEGTKKSQKGKNESGEEE